MRGMVPLDGGWRIYSSGAGIGTRLILCCFLGLRQEKSALVLDPAIPPSLDGLRVELEMSGHSFEVIYRIESTGCGPISLKSFAVSSVLVANVVGYAGTASALPAVDRLAIKNASPSIIHSVQWGWGWGRAAPAIAGGVVAGAPYYYGPGPYYYPYYPRPYYAPAPAGYYAPGYYSPQSGEGATAYCSRRFRSYNPSTGTYLGTDGYRHPCP
jgi:hypothetical protein